MAAIGNIEAMLSGIQDQQLQLIMKSVFRYLIQRGVAFGRATDPNTSQVPSQNMQGGFFTATTPSVANTEFAIAHRFGRAPYLAMQVLPLDQANAAIVRLTNSTIADATNVYFKSPETSQPVFVYLEG